MSDVKDILGVSRAGGQRSDAKKEKEKVQRPAGMSREAFALLDGSHPLPPSLAGDLRKKSDLHGLKEKRKASKDNITWQWREFENQARPDGLKLSHWEKCCRDAAGKIHVANPGDYRFAKYNKKAMVYKYNDEEWNNVIAKDPDWSREESDYLLDLCELYDLRFIIIADRYQYPTKSERDVDDLKGRYYSIARQLMIAREGNQEDIENHVIIKAPFDAAHEKERKRALELLMTRTPQQEAEENAVLEQAKVIEAARKAEEAKRKAAAPQATPQQPGAGPGEAALPITFTDAVPAGTPSLLGHNLQPARPKKPGVYLRRVHTNQTAQAMVASVSGGPRGAKLLEGMLADLNAADPPKIGTRAVCGTWLALRSEIIAMLELKKKVMSKQDTGTPASSTDNRSKRGVKNKAGRFEEDVEMPKEKRPRVAKKFADD